jgi:hypothetical protein
MLGAKISIVLLYQRLAPQQASKGMLFLYGCIGVWAVFAILAQSFQCGGNVIFTPEQCLSGWSLQGAAESRLIPIILFGLRIFVCFVALAQLIVYAFNMGSDDTTWSQTTPVVFNL